jgi:hypothetical protein
MMLNSGCRSTSRNEVKISFGGQLMIQVLMRIGETSDPIQVDYFNQFGQAQGTVQLGIMKWIGQEACFCMAGPGQIRPDNFDSPPRSGRTLSQWRQPATHPPSPLEGDFSP